MTIKEELNKKIETELKQTPEYKLLLNLIKKEKITSIQELRHHVSTEIKRYKECLKKCCKAGNTTNRNRSKEAHTIEFLELINKKIISKLT